MANGRMLLNKKHVRDYILERQLSVRPGWRFTYVANQVYEDLNARVRLLIDKSLHSHPSMGKTFRQIS